VISNVTNIQAPFGSKLDTVRQFQARFGRQSFITAITPPLSPVPAKVLMVAAGRLPASSQSVATATGNFAKNKLWIVIENKFEILVIFGVFHPLFLIGFFTMFYPANRALPPTG